MLPLVIPPIVLAIVSTIQAAIKYAPTAIALFKVIRDNVTMLFQKKLITKEQQDQLHTWVDAICAQAEAGKIPASWQVEADPEA